MSEPTILAGRCAGGTVNLSGYPGLAYAPKQHGEGIRLAHNGKPVEEVAADPELAAAADVFAAHAARHGVSFGDMCDAVRYHRSPQ